MGGQWFHLIDKVAEHQYVIYPKAVLGNKVKYVVPNSYNHCKNKIIQLEWPPEPNDVQKSKRGKNPKPKVKVDYRVDEKQLTTKPLGSATKIKSGKKAMSQRQQQRQDKQEMSNPRYKIPWKMKRNQVQNL